MHYFGALSKKIKIIVCCNTISLCCEIVNDEMMELFFYAFQNTTKANNPNNREGYRAFFSELERSLSHYLKKVVI